jgi:trans-aconitate methyltransferase
MKNFIRSLTLPQKFAFTDKHVGNKVFNLLDIGAGNHSASLTKKVFPNCQYYGVDLDKHYNNDEADFNCMTAFYEMNLDDLNFNSIPEYHFDVILLNHVIEHLQHGEEVIKGLLPKLKKGGMIYIEFPGFRSTQLPRMEGTLNFFDDDTHVHIHSTRNIMNLLMKNNMRIIAGGTRRHTLNILMMPFKIPFTLLRYRKIVPSIFWDVLGFANYVVAVKK